MARKRYIEGADNVLRVLGDMPRISAENIAHALNLGAREIAETAKMIVPRDTGELAETIDIQPSELKHGARGIVATIVAGTTKERAAAALGMEYGRAPGPDGHPGHNPQPFMQPAYWAKRKRVIGRIKRAIKAAAKAVARNG